MSNNNLPPSSSDHDPGSQSFERSEDEHISAEQAERVMQTMIKDVYGERPDPEMKDRFLFSVMKDGKTSAMLINMRSGSADASGELQRAISDERQNAGHILSTPLASVKQPDGSIRTVTFWATTYGGLKDNGELHQPHTNLVIVDRTVLPSGEARLTTTPTVLFSHDAPKLTLQETSLAKGLYDEFSAAELTELLQSAAREDIEESEHIRLLRVLDTVNAEETPHGVDFPVSYSPTSPTSRG